MSKKPTRTKRADTQKNESASDAHLDWLVESRSACQKCSLELFKMLKKHAKTLKEQEGASNFAQGLVAVSFSMWRAVFLGDISGSPEEVLRHAEGFLLKLITDNAINYPQDRNAREWTFQYYVNNARYRLEAITNLMPSLLSYKLEWETERSPTEQWDYYHVALCEVVRNFDKMLKIAA